MDKWEKNVGGKDNTHIVLLEKPEVNRETSFTAEPVPICSGFVRGSGWVSEIDCDWTRDNREKYSQTF